MRRRVYPDKPKVARLLSACLDIQSLLKLVRIQLIVECPLLLLGRKAPELPGLVGTGLDEIGAKGDLQPFGQGGGGDEVVTALEGRHRARGQGPQRALEAGVLVVEVGAGKGKRAALG